MAAPIDEVEEDACVNPFSFQRFVSGQNAIDHSQPPAKGRSRLSPTTAGSLRLMDASTVTVECERVLEERPDAIGQCSPEPVPCWDRRDVELPDPAEEQCSCDHRSLISRLGRGKRTTQTAVSGGARRTNRLQLARLEALEEEQKAQRHKEREETAALEQVVRQVECSLKAALERASSAELASARLKQQVKTLQARCRQLETDFHSNLSQATTDISAKLRTAADDAEMSLRSLLKGVDQLRLYSSLVASLSKVQEEVS
uniref:Endosome-associated-trafficking regulator 1 n=1 Tax=Ixodes ricinus TaxID=34613 RepID=V5HIH2_IXORI